MKVKNKRRFAISMIILTLVALVVITAIGFALFKGGQAIINMVANKGGEETVVEVVYDEEPQGEKGTIGANFDQSVLAVADFSLWGITNEDFAAEPMPETDNFETEYDLQFALADGRFEKQDSNNSSGFAAAYMLRANKKDASGKEAYYSMESDVLPNGYHFPSAIKKYLDKNSTKVTMYTGTVDTLKSRLVKSNLPVIVLVGDSLNWQHYMCFTGYDTLQAELYFVDSSLDKDTNAEKPGNRTMHVSEFEQVWDNSLPVYNKLYLAAK